MARIYWNKNLKDSSVKVITLKQRDIKDRVELIRKNYLIGNIIIIEDFQIPVNLNIFNFESLPQLPNHGTIPDDQYNFFKMNFKKPRNTDRVIKKIYRDADKAKRLKEAMKFSQEYVFKVLANIFESRLIYKYEAFKKLDLDISTWRFTDTVKSAYHIDVYPGINFRAFWNLSDKPRVWGFGHSTNDITKLKLNEVLRFMRDPKNTSDQGMINFHQADLNAYLNTYLEGFETHKIEFKKYDLWLCDSLKVGHQIISGDKMAGFTYPLMNNVWKVPEETFDKLNYQKYVLEFLSSELKLRAIRAR